MNRFCALPVLLVLTAPWAFGAESVAARDQAAYVDAVTRGAGLMPWQAPGLSEEETRFRAEIEARKDRMLGRRTPVVRPVMLDQESLARARENIATTDWARAWFENNKAIADHIVAQPEGYIEAMIPELTPANSYGLTCANCVGTKSQEGVGTSLFAWDYRNPDVLTCRRCGQTYPDPAFPEEAILECPRMGQTLAFYKNPAERASPDDRSGDLAWHWVGHPIHAGYQGVIRMNKAAFMADAAGSLAYAHAMTGEARYAEAGRRILLRLAHCYRNWLYHDYWGAVADCDPLYAAWHDRALPIEWKRHLCTSVYAKDKLDKAAMLQTYWGAGRLHPSTDSVSLVSTLCVAYDLLHDAEDGAGQPIWTKADRDAVERDLLLEWVMGAEPYLGGEGKAERVDNKTPRIYHAMAAVGKCLGLPAFADVAYRGYEGLRDKSFIFDGFSGESPAYTNMYLSSLVGLTEGLHGAPWPAGSGKEGRIDLYGGDPRLRLMFRAVVDQVHATGSYVPLSDTNVRGRPSLDIVEVGLHRYPEYYGGKLRALAGGKGVGEHAVFHLTDAQVTQDAPLDPPELLFPAWMTAFLRHGIAAEAALLTMTFSPPGGHRHEDNLAIYYVDGGDTILGDHGYLGDMPVNRWIHATESHNLVVVDDGSQRHAGRRPSLELMATSPLVSVVEASTTAYKQCETYRRLVALVKGPEGRTFAVDIFRVRGGKKHAYRVSNDVASSEAPEGKLLFEGVEMPPEPPLLQVGQSLADEDIFGLRDVRSAAAPESWQAIWADSSRHYRLWMCAPVDRVEASNGPGQTTRENAGRRLRYVDAVREGDPAQSTFVVVHEPGPADGDMPIQDVRRIETPAEAGPNAVALRIASAWGDYIVFNEFDHAAEVEGIRFEGRFALLVKAPGGECRALSLGASSLLWEGPGFEKGPAAWAGGAGEASPDGFTAATPMPEGWPPTPPGCSNYALVDVGELRTGFAVSRVEGGRVSVARFPVPEASAFALYALRLAP